MHIPKHIAIIMDGNGRWAKRRLLPRIAGHVRGVVRVKEIIKYSSSIGIKYLTLFAFGRENWNRPKEEVTFLMKLLYDQLAKEFENLHTKEIKVNFIGDRTRLNKDIVQKINQVEELTKHNNKMSLNIALDYSGTYDVVQAVNRLLKENITEIDEKNFSKYLLTYPIPNPELLIRTSGEARLSNFMLWQIAYTECYFTNKYWPEFSTKQLDIAIKWYNTRERRFGMISEQLNNA